MHSRVQFVLQHEINCPHQSPTFQVVGSQPRLCHSCTRTDIPQKHLHVLTTGLLWFLVNQRFVLDFSVLGEVLVSEVCGFSIALEGISCLPMVMTRALQVMVHTGPVSLFLMARKSRVLNVGMSQSQSTGHLRLYRGLTDLWPKVIVTANSFASEMMVQYIR